MALPFVNPVSQSMPGFGSPSYYGAATTTVTTAATTTITIANTSTTPSTGGTAFNIGGGPAPSRGKMRIRINTISGTTAITYIQLTVTDGTTVETIDWLGPFTAGQITALDYTQEFSTDLSITSTSVVVVTTGSAINSVVDVEVSLV
jgi:hypothetical protein